MSQERKKKVRTTGVQKPTKTDRLHFRVDPELKEEIQRAAVGDNRSVAGWIETIVRRELAKKSTKH